MTPRHLVRVLAVCALVVGAGGCAAERSGTVADDDQGPRVAGVHPNATIAELVVIQPTPAARTVNEAVTPEVIQAVAGQWLMDMDGIAQEVRKGKGIDDGFWMLLRNELIVVRADGTVVHCGRGEGVWRRRDDRVVFEGAKGIDRMALLLPAEGKPVRLGVDTGNAAYPIKKRIPAPAIDGSQLDGAWRLNMAATTDSLAEDALAMGRMSGQIEMTHAEAVQHVKEHLVDESMAQSRIVFDPVRWMNGTRGIGQIVLGGESVMPMRYTIEEDVVIVRVGPEEDPDGMALGFTMRDGKLVLEFGFLPWVYAR